MIRLCFVCCLLSYTHTHTHDEIVSCVRVKVVRAHAAVIDNKSHKWKYSRKVGINGLNEFSRVNREIATEIEKEMSWNCIWRWYVTKTTALRTCDVNYKRTFLSFNCATLLHLLFENGVFALKQFVPLIRLILSLSYHLVLFFFSRLVGIYFTTAAREGERESGCWLQCHVWMPYKYF